MKLDPGDYFGWSPATGHQGDDSTLRKLLSEQALHDGPEFIVSVVLGSERTLLSEGRHWLEYIKATGLTTMHYSIHHFFATRSQCPWPLVTSQDVCSLAFLDAITLPLGMSEEDVGRIASAVDVPV